MQKLLVAVRVILMSLGGVSLIYWGDDYREAPSMVLGAALLAWPQLELFLARKAT